MKLNVSKKVVKRVITDETLEKMRTSRLENVPDLTLSVTDKSARVTVSRKMMQELNLNNYGATYDVLEDGSGVVFVVLDEENSSFLTGTKKKDKKSRGISHGGFIDSLIATGLIPAEHIATSEEGEQSIIRGLELLLGFDLEKIEETFDTGEIEIQGAYRIVASKNKPVGKKGEEDDDDNDEPVKTAEEVIADATGETVKEVILASEQEVEAIVADAQKATEKDDDWA